LNDFRCQYLMKPLKYIIIEDSRLDELALMAVLSQYPLLQYITTARTLTEAGLYIRAYKPNVIFIDIEMPDGLGIDFAKNVHGFNPIIIFITSYAEFALEGFETSALDYLLKPVSEERFALTYQNIIDYYKMSSLARMQLEQSEMETIVFKDGFNKIRLPVKQVLYLQAMQDYTKIVTCDKSYLTNNTLSVFLKENHHFNFIRIHRSYAILNQHIQILKKDKIVGPNFELPIGKTYRSAIAKLKL
jgi:DNA-binding LytR/AlgR family response regulator